MSEAQTIEPQRFLSMQQFCFIVGAGYAKPNSTMKIPNATLDANCGARTLRRTYLRS
jgi:hypothetical protein